MNLKGRLERRDIGTGVWLLHTPRGRVALFGEVPAELDGREVDVVGDELDGMSAGMVGDRMVQVRSVRAS